MAKLNGVKTVSERIQYNGAEYVKSDGAAVVGDIVRHDVDGYGFLPKGSFYEVVRIDSFGDPQIIDEDGDEIDADNEFSVFKRVEPVASPQQPQYREVKRKANVGERIRIVDAWLTLGKYKNGDEFSVSQVISAGGVMVSGVDMAIVDREYVVLESVDNDKKPVEEPRLKVGEYAKIVSKVGGILNGFSEGEIVKVIENHYGPGDKHYRVARFSDESETGYAAKKGGLVRATDAEVAEAKRAAEEAAKKAAKEKKWAVIGRKVGEIRNGDIVRVLTDSPKSSLLSKGEIGNVSSFDGVRFRVNTMTKTFCNFVHAEDVELIAPVESLFSTAE